MHGAAGRFRISDRSISILGWTAAAFGLACVGVHLWGWLAPHLSWSLHPISGLPDDTRNYILAGLRLNAGHPLYAYGPGDPVVMTHEGPSSYPLFSPPLIGVLFRLIVLLPANGGYIWWACMAGVDLVAILALTRRQPLLTGIALLPLGASVSWTMYLGNVDCLVVAGLVLSCCWLASHHDDRAALMIGLLASLKLTPVLFVWWLVVTGRFRAAVVAAAAGAVLAVVAMLGSEPLVFLKFFDVLQANMTQPQPDNFLGPMGLARLLGAPDSVVAWLPRAILLGGVAAMWAARHRPGLAWAIAAFLMWFGSPVVAVHTPALAVVAIAPIAWRIPQLPVRVGIRRMRPTEARATL